MKAIVLVAAVAVSATAAHAQLFGGVVFDPTQAVNAGTQIQQGVQMYTTTVQTTQNVIAAYNLAKQMASSPSMLWRPYTMPFTSWTAIAGRVSAYGNTAGWVNAANTGTGAQGGYQAASLPTPTALPSYSSLDLQSQQLIAAQSATSTLGDSVNADNLQTFGLIRANEQQHEADIHALEDQSFSSDPLQQTDLATEQRINRAMIYQLQLQREANRIATANALAQMVAQKQQTDAIKENAQQANGFEQNWNNTMTPLLDNYGTSIAH